MLRWIMASTFVLAPAVGLGAGERKDDVAFEDLPPAVQETVTREVGEGEIEDIERDLELGEVVYEVEYVVDQQDYEIEVAEDGTLLSRLKD